jgi:hypothetical protein
VPPLATTLPTVPGQIDPSNFPPPYNLPPYSQAPYNPYLPVTPTTPTTATTVPAGAFTSPTSQPGTQAPFLPPQYGTTNTTLLYQAAPVR